MIIFILFVSTGVLFERALSVLVSLTTQYQKNNINIISKKYLKSSKETRSIDIAEDFVFLSEEVDKIQVKIELKNGFICMISCCMF